MARGGWGAARCPDGPFAHTERPRASSGCRGAAQEARGAAVGGFAETRSVSQMADAPMALALLHEGRGPILIRARIASDEVPRVLPTRDGREMRDRFALCDRGHHG